MNDLSSLESVIADAQAAHEACRIEAKMIAVVDMETFRLLCTHPQNTFRSTGREKLECVTAGVTFRV